MVPVAAVLVPLIAAALLIGCNSVEQRYRVLSFFFDGVPVPASLAKDMLALTPEGTPAVPGRAEAEKPVVYYYHAPYANRSCFGCHDRQKGYDASMPGAELCAKCHETYFGLERNDWVHGPAFLGECRLCHQPHKSEHLGLLTAQEPNLCFACHTESFFSEDELHAQMPEDVKCSTCHDPHAAGNRLLLIDSRTHRRRRRMARQTRSTHALWKQEQCNKCHDSEQANQVKPGVNSACLSCHTAIGEQLNQPQIHQAVRDAQCIACHTPHKSSRPKLIRAKGEKICYSCHKPQEVRTPNHPKVTRVDCLLCHGGHQTGEPKLLKSTSQILKRLIELQEDSEGDEGDGNAQGQREAP